MKGICFIEPLYHKVVAGQKTQTRRIIKSSTGFFNVESTRDGVIQDIWKCDADGSNGDDLIPVKPKYKVGETAKTMCILPFAVYISFVKQYN